MSDNYKSAGVDIRAGELTVENIKDLVKPTFNSSVLTGIGHFGAFYELKLQDYKNPVLVSSVDGVGTKLKIAIMMNKHDTIGQDLVNHCVNDIAVCGAAPLYFLDYMAFGRLLPEKATEIIKGFSIACKDNNTALIGGETAEMPGLYDKDDYDLSGTIVGIVEKEKIINGKNVQKGNVLLGFNSNGLHTNGYSLARKVLLGKYNLSDKPHCLGSSLGDELLKIHKSYLGIIHNLKSEVEIHAFSHITGGGILGNTKRVIPDGLKINIDWKSWNLPPIFSLIQDTGNVADEEMREVFNMGIGLIAILDEKNVDRALKIAYSLNEPAIIMGEIS